jgi:hypothetical protein
MSLSLVRQRRLISPHRFILSVCALMIAPRDSVVTRSSQFSAKSLNVGDVFRSLPGLSCAQNGKALTLALAFASFFVSAGATAGTARVGVGIYSANFSSLEEDTKTLVPVSDPVALPFEHSHVFPNNASGSGMAEVRLEPGFFVQEAFTPKLRARATGTKTTDGPPFDYPTEVVASAVWSDVISWQPAALFFLYDTLGDRFFERTMGEVEFQVSVQGAISNGLYARADITAIWEEPGSGLSRRVHTGETFQGPRFGVTDPTVLKIEVPASALIGGVDLSIALTATGGTDDQKIDGTTDFSNTASLMPILIADANGNHIPGTEILRIMGDGGMEYQTGIVGDYNASGTVEQADLDLVLLYWGAGGVPEGWINDLPEGNIDQAELDGVLLHWGNMAGAGTLGAAAVPEPGGLWLVFLAGACLLTGPHRIARRKLPQPPLILAAATAGDSLVT